MLKICPVSTRMISESISRMNAFFTFVFAALFLATGNMIYLLVMISDFILRNICHGRLNPVLHLNRYLTSLLPVGKKMVNAGPKVFASRVGLFLSVSGMILMLMVSFSASLLPVCILGLFSFLELTFGYCIACQIYPYILPLNDKLENVVRS